MVDFYDSFSKEADTDQEIPEEIINLLNQELPDNLVYYRNEKGDYTIIPKPDVKTIRMSGELETENISEGDHELIEKIKTLPRDKWAEYLYRSQKSLPVKNMRIGNNSNLISIGKTLGNPLSDEEVLVTDCRICPSPFPEPVTLLFESKEGEKRLIKFQQKALDSFTEVKYSNIDFPALIINIYVYAPLTEADEKDAKTSKENRIRTDYSVTPTKADTVSDALCALHLFRGLFTGETKVNGHEMTSQEAQLKFDPQRMDDIIDFWTRLSKVEKKIGVQFHPDADFPNEDVKFFTELDACFNNKKDIVWKHPFDHFHINNFREEITDEKENALLGNEGLGAKFIEGPIECTLLGAEFALYSITTLSYFVITNIEWDDEKKQGCEVYVSDAPDKIWELKRHFITAEEAENLKVKSARHES